MRYPPGCRTVWGPCECTDWSPQPATDTHVDCEEGARQTYLARDVGQLCRRRAGCRSHTGAGFIRCADCGCYLWLQSIYCATNWHVLPQEKTRMDVQSGSALKRHPSRSRSEPFFAAFFLHLCCLSLFSLRPLPSIFAHLPTLLLTWPPDA